jgi:hypothetical protein
MAVLLLFVAFIAITATNLSGVLVPDSWAGYSVVMFVLCIFLFTLLVLLGRG